MDTQQIIADLELVRDILTLDASPARRAAAAVLLRAAAAAIEAETKMPMLRSLVKGEIIGAGDYFEADGKRYRVHPSCVSEPYDPEVHLPHFRPVNDNH